MKTAVRCLALEPWLGGSHERFWGQWCRRSRHRVEIHGLPARLWKWRMRSAAWEIARELARRDAPPPELILASDFLDLPTWLGFLPASWRALPTLLYFHENQLTYPARPGVPEAERDSHYGFTNILSCVRADRVVFNSSYHQGAFGDAAARLLERLPRPNPLRELKRAIEHSRVISPGIDLDQIPLGPGAEAGQPLRVLFPHRLEHDKDPRAFLEAVLRARREGARIELVLLGERFGKRPAGVGELLAEVGVAVLHDGFAASRAEYASWLGRCDLVVSTARHEFFGLAVCEALAAGCTPLLPARLSYPELMPEELRAEGLFARDEELTGRLARASSNPEDYRGVRRRVAMRAAIARYSAEETSRQLDGLIDELVLERGERRSKGG